MTHNRPGPARRLWQWWKRGLDPLRTANAFLRHHLRSNANYARGWLLDIGCGSKPYRDLFQVERYTGIDFPLTDQGAIDVYASGLSLPFASAVFDTVLSTEVLEHVPEPSQLMSEAYRVLRPGGYLLLTTPQTWGLHHVPHDFYRFTPFGLRYLAEKSGFNVIRVDPTTGFWVTFSQRLCDVIFYTDGVPNFSRPLQELVKIPLALIQIAGVGLDKIWGRRGDTLDNLLIAQRLEQ
jgi:SAM-dependent methyltransferase